MVLQVVKLCLCLVSGGFCFAISPAWFGLLGSFRLFPIPCLPAPGIIELLCSFIFVLLLPWVLFQLLLLG
jgi:hypothetical protein